MHSLQSLILFEELFHVTLWPNNLTIHIILPHIWTVTIPRKGKERDFLFSQFCMFFFFLNNITDDKLLSVMVVLDAYLFKLLSNEFILGSLYTLLRPRLVPRQLLVSGSPGKAPGTTKVPKPTCQAWFTLLPPPSLTPSPEDAPWNWLGWNGSPGLRPTTVPLRVLPPCRPSGRQQRGGPSQSCSTVGLGGVLTV